MPIGRQRTARAGSDGFVLWDYHVFAVRRGARAGAAMGGSSVVYDVDTTLDPFPAPFEDYRREALQEVRVEGFPEDHTRRLYRVVPARETLARFASDRSHMRTPMGGWKMFPPTWPPIGGGLVDSANKNTLPAFLDMRRGVMGRSSDAPGRLLDEAEFVDFFAPSALEE